MLVKAHLELQNTMDLCLSYFPLSCCFLLRVDTTPIELLCYYISYEEQEVFSHRRRADGAKRRRVFFRVKRRN